MDRCPGHGVTRVDKESRCPLQNAFKVTIRLGCLTGERLAEMAHSLDCDAVRAVDFRTRRAIEIRERLREEPVALRDGVGIPEKQGFTPPQI